MQLMQARDTAQMERLEVDFIENRRKPDPTHLPGNDLYWVPGFYSLPRALAWPSKLLASSVPPGLCHCKTSEDERV